MSVYPISSNQATVPDKTFCLAPERRMSNEQHDGMMFNILAMLLSLTAYYVERTLFCRVCAPLRCSCEHGTGPLHNGSRLLCIFVGTRYCITGFIKNIKFFCHERILLPRSLLDLFGLGQMVSEKNNNTTREGEVSW